MPPWRVVNLNTEIDVLRIRWTTILAGLLIATATPDRAIAQVSQADSVIAMLTAAKRSGVTRAELEASLVEIERILASGGYSGAIKSAKRDEAVLIRHRLEQGDLRPGDIVRVGVARDATLTKDYIVTPAMTIVIPSLGSIPVQGLLRSEVEAHLQREIAKYVRDPVVLAEALIRVAILGGVGSPGFYSVSAGQAISEVIMGAAGGLAGSADLEKGNVRRGDREIVSSAAFTAALREGRTLDQLNMQAGDEITVGIKRPNTATRVLAVVSGLASLAFVIFRVF